MTSHFHVDHGNLPGYFLVRAMEPGDTGRECDCLDGELELFHDACEAFVVALVLWLAVTG